MEESLSMCRLEAARAEARVEESATAITHWRRAAERHAMDRSLQTTQISPHASRKRDTDTRGA